MTKPPTVEHPGNQPAPATQSRSGKGRPAKAGSGHGRGTAAPAGKGQAPPGQDAAAGLLRRLTAREAQAFAHLAAGRDLAETAAALGVTTTTARSYQHRALRKLGTRTQDEITALAALLSTPDATDEARPNSADAKPRRGAARTGDRAEPRPPADGERPSPERGAAAAAALGDPAARARTDTPATTGVDGRTEPGTPADGERALRDTPGAPAPTHTPGRDTAAATPGGPASADARTGRAEAAAPPGTGPVAMASPTRQEDTHRPEADAAGTNRPRGVRDPGLIGKDPTARRTAGGGGKPRTVSAGQAMTGQPSTAGRDGGEAAERAADAGRGSAERDDRRATAKESATAATGGPTPPGRDRKTAPGSATAGRTRAAAKPAAATAGRPDAPGPAGGTGGDRAATGRGDGPGTGFEEVYEAAHTRLVQQVFLLTACRHRAVHCVGRAFGEARRRWAAAVAGGDPEAWVRARAFELALSPWHRGGPRRTHVWRLPHRRIKVRPADEAQAVLPDHDRLTDHDRALLKALRRLSRPRRRALVLHDGLGMPAAAVAVEVESTVTAAEGRVWAARAALVRWVPELVGPDPAADGFADRLCALMHRAAVRGAPQPHRAPVPLLRARHGLANAGRTGAAALLTAAVGGAVVATLAGGGPGELFRPPGPPPPSLCAPFPTSATDPDAPLPLLADGPPSGIRSLWCSPTPGLEPVVLDPPPPRDGPYRPPTGGRAAEALPPPRIVAAEPQGCAPPWSLHPCPATG
ncbi:LuxR C-terminal-related transcriptional regulator [Kitasatospora sp. NPDC001527]|uniref:LuxR C-terminal-related transcriptional regulator n=1 Tax=Kitasatospora sp. NPDC001527 TaxID=3154519 RepID=UPI00331EFA09